MTSATDENARLRAESPLHKAMIRARGRGRALAFVSRMLWERGRLFPSESGPTALLDLPRISRIPENWFGRLTYSVMFLLHASGYKLYLKGHPRFLAGFRRQKYAQLALGLDPAVAIGTARFGRHVLHIHDRPRPPSNLHRTLRLEYDPAAWPGEDRGNLAMPFLMHPLIYQTEACGRLQSLRLSRRSIRLFFAGNVGGLYDSPALRRAYGKMSRAAVLEHLRRHLDGERIDVVLEQDPLIRADAAHARFVWYGSAGGRIEPPQWLALLARCDFFLGCPGVTKPMSHNVVEAMAVGCVPVLEYPEYFHPPLRHMNNCVAFRGPDDLLQKVQHVLGMDPATVARLRQGVIDYFEAHLTHAAFARKLAAADADATLHVMAQTAPDRDLVPA